MNDTLRLGEISFINALPFSLSDSILKKEGIKKTILPPTGLNRAIFSGELDISPVSSAFYLRHKSQFTLLTDLSISAEKPVKSVLLFLPSGWDSLSPATPIAVPGTSETSIALMQYILFQKTGLMFKENLVSFAPGGADSYLQQGVPVLVIGDEALTLAKAFANRTEIVDLAEAWQSTTHKSFVFAVWVARNDWAKKHPTRLTEVNRLLQAQKSLFLSESLIQSAIIAKAHQQCPHLDEDLLRHYFTVALSYHLQDEHLQALTKFEEILNWLDDDTADFSERHRSLLSV
jgi:chorismate dehydratase